MRLDEFFVFAPRHRPAHTNEALRWLISLRWLSLGGMLVVLWGAPALLHIPLPTEALTPIALALGLTNGASVLRARQAREVSGHELFGQLCIDLAAWSSFLYFTGGATNPLISLLLPLVAIGAAVLPAPHAWALALLAVVSYSLLWDNNEQLDIYDSGLAVHWHLAGMWLTFSVSAGIIVWYVVRMTAALRARDQALAEAREARLRNERIVALGNLAAGAAHELGTPLGTMAILAGELARNPGLDADTREDAQLLLEQISHCKGILGSLTLRAGSLRAEGAERLPADAWLETIFDHWRTLRPHVPLQTRLACGDPAPVLVADGTLEQAIHNLINNAADACPTGIECEAAIQAEHLEIRVLDRGPGMPAKLRAQAGLASLEGRGEGLGIGLLLAFGAVERCGGRIQFEARPGGGTLALLSLPLAALCPDLQTRNPS